jgi:2-polyprenyl-3-methyl-5-hydroxy-6-metoxy-1,4-benzoquinol methylase
MKKNNPDLEILKLHLKPFLKNDKFELDSNNKQYHQISNNLCQFLEKIVLKNKEINQIYDKIFIHLLDNAQIDISRSLKYYSNFYIQRSIKKFFEKILLEKKNKEEYFHKEFLNTIINNNSFILNRKKLVEVDNILKLKILSADEFIKFLSDETIHKILKKIIISDPVNEKFFTEIRKIILEEIINNKKIKINIIENFSSKLSSNCFFNEYSWLESDEEFKNINLLEEKMLLKFNQNKKVSLSEIFILASYRPLFKYKKMLKYFLKFDNEIIKDQISDYIVEEKFIKNIKTLSPIENQISINVKNQYEEYPYPRWNLFKKDTNTIQYYDYINQVSSNKIIPKKIKKILVAGCGTGKHPISIALADPSLDIFAIDLSKRSLAYASRKANELNIDSIKWIHGDILDLKKLNESFDVIESVGVLHHMEDPNNGFDILYKILEPKGFLKLGLYAKSFRNSLKSAKNLLVENNYSKNLRSIQKARRLISKNEKDNVRYPAILLSDFYITSSFVDLLIHEQELDFDINDLLNLYEKNFTFLGFTGNPLKKSQFNNALKKIEITENEMENWKRLEKLDPFYFSNMYQFWLQKK